MNCVGKGKRVQLLARDSLVHDGYLVEVVPHLRFKKDYFNLFDLICVGHGFVRFIQVKSGRRPDLDWYLRCKAWLKDTSLDVTLNSRVRVEVWVWKCGGKAASHWWKDEV